MPFWLSVLFDGPGHGHFEDLQRSKPSESVAALQKQLGIDPDQGGYATSYIGRERAEQLLNSRELA